MAWVTPTSRTTGTLITASIWNEDVVNNPIALRAGALALASQAAGDFFYASSATQMGRVAIAAAGTFIRSNGTLPVWSALVLPNGATSGYVVFATGANTYGESANLTFDTQNLTLFGGIGVMGSGGNAVAAFNFSGTTTSTATSQYGVRAANWSNTSSATVGIGAIDVGISTAAASYTTGDVWVAGFNGIIKGASHVITRLWGVAIQDLTGGTNNVLLYLGGCPAAGSTFTGAWAIFQNTTKASYFNGGVSVGTTTTAGTGNVLIGTGNNQLGVGSILADAQFSLTGTFTGNSGNTLGYVAGLSLTTTLSPDVTRNAFVCRLAPTIVEAASGTHTLLAALRIILTITNGGATTTDAAGIDVNTFAAGAGTTTASGIRIDGPTGATNNYSLNILSGMTLVGAGALVGQMPTVFSPSTVRVMSVSTGSTDKLAGFFSQQTSIAQTSGPQGFEGYAYTSHTSGTVSLMIGMIGNSEHSGTSTTTAMRGGQFQVLTTSSGGGTDAAACFASCTGQVAGGSGTFTNGYCFFAAGFGSGYTNKYAFYSADANSLMLVPGVYNNTSGSAANMFIDSTGLMFRSTSSLAFKTDLEPIAIEDARRVIRALSPGGVAAGFTYRSVGAVDRRRFLGWGAEQVAPVDPLLASFTRAGEPESVMYDRATVYLAALVTDQDDTIRRLTDQVAALETRLNRAA